MTIYILQPNRGVGVEAFVVTFMNGTELLEKVRVQKGDSAVFSLNDPTKPEDENYTYTFAGWASSDGKESGEAGILDNIQANKTVYAAFSKVHKPVIVTFMNGSVVWDTVTVPYGGTASTSKGNPAKASDDNYDYSFVGWASVDGKESDESGILDNITSPKTVYAAYSKARNSFTVTFMNGSVVWDTVKVKKGQNAVCSKGDPSKAEDEQYTYSFIGWNSYNGADRTSSTILQNITSDKTVYAVFSKIRKPIFVDTISKSWDEIISDAENKKTSDYTLGGIKNIRFPDGWHAYELAGINVDDLADGSGKAPFTFIAKTIDGTCRWNNSDTNVNGYPSSAYKTYLETTCMSHIPDNIKNAIKEVSKVCAIYSPENRDFSYTAKIWAPNLREMNLISYYSTSNYETTGAQYTIYGTRESRYRYDTSGDIESAWLTSVYMYDDTNANIVYVNGECSHRAPSSTQGALPCFCL